MHHHFIRAVLWLLLCALPVAAQTKVTDKVDEFIAAEMQKQHIPGLSLAVSKAGQIAYVKGYGLANVEHQVAVRPETVFQSGSVGKQFTATAVMMLVQDGRLALDDHIAKYFPDAPPHWQQITIRHLLTHTAGTTDYPDDFDFRRDYTEAELFKAAARVPLAFQPGEKFSYSNLGYVMLGLLVSKVTGKFYGEFLQERIFKPLGMATARIISEADIVPNRAAGYRLVKGELKNQEWVAPTLNTTADGPLYLTALDMAKWDAALDTEKLLKKSSLAQMWTPLRLSSGVRHHYGFGWAMDNINGHRLIEHGGSWQGFKAHIARYTDDKLTIVVFANLAQARPADIAHGVAAIWNPDYAERVAEDKQPQMTALVQAMLKNFVAGTADQVPFTPTARAGISKAELAQMSRVLRAFGPVGAMTLTESAADHDGRWFRYKVMLREGSLFCLMKVNGEQQIAAIQLHFAFRLMLDSDADKTDAN